MASLGAGSSLLGRNKRIQSGLGLGLFGAVCLGLSMFRWGGLVLDIFVGVIWLVWEGLSVFGWLGWLVLAWQNHPVPPKKVHQTKDMPL